MPNKRIFEVGLAVRGIDLDNDGQIAQVFDMFGDDVQVSGSSNNGMVHLLLDTDDPLIATNDAITQLESRLPEVKVFRVDTDLVAIPDIARRIGRSRENVRQFADGTRGPGGFPVPDGTVGDAIRVWRWANVEPWLRNNTDYNFPTIPVPTGVVDALNTHLCNAGRLVSTVTRDERQDYVMVAVGRYGPREPAVPFAIPASAWQLDDSSPDDDSSVAA
ncbi:MAG: hypothetical protein M1399_04285 [Actinobacteria bacterium]|nr:hypothetical protein [Actinomycetota bacterium]